METQIFSISVCYDRTRKHLHTISIYIITEMERTSSQRASAKYYETHREEICAKMRERNKKNASKQKPRPYNPEYAKVMYANRVSRQREAMLNEVLNREDITEEQRTLLSAFKDKPHLFTHAVSQGLGLI